MNTGKSKKLYREASRYMPGGVNSPVRAFKAVGGSPLFIKRSSGSRLYDEDSNEFVDYVMSWGALILGHAHPKVVEAVRSASGHGMSFGAPSKRETELAKVIHAAIPSIEKIRLVNSGTEAVMSAIRLSRGFTKRDKIVKFDGSYHGHYDGLLVKAGSGSATYGIPDSAGISNSIKRDTIVCPYNDIKTLASIIRKHYRDIACVVVEPVSANMGLVLPAEDFLINLRKLTERYGIVLIFDEVITGFRLRFGGIQDYFKVKPDLTCLGKIIGAGLPIGAYGGRQDMMNYISPQGPVYQAGTLSGNPVAVSAGLAALKELSLKNYPLLGKKTDDLCDELGKCLKLKKIPFVINHIGSLFTVFFTTGKVTDFISAKRSNLKVYAKYFWSMLREGVYMPPSQFEANFVSFAHSKCDMGATVRAHEIAVKRRLSAWV